jgi:DNA repair protein RecN (Recombination protein N)
VLVHLGVRDLAIVDNLELDLRAGMTALTGETGAGKSLIVDALELVVGERASAELVRPGAAGAEVSAVFEPRGPALAWLREQALDDGERSCVLRRLVSADGRSRAFINGRPVAVAQLRALGEQLVDVHGQHAHQALLKSHAQREVLDAFADNEDALARVAALHASLRGLDEEIAQLGDAGADPAARLDYLDFQIGELRAQPVAPAQLDAINAEHSRLAHAAELLEAVAAASGIIDDEDTGAATAIASALRVLERALRLDPALAAPRDLLAHTATLLGEATTELRRYAEHMHGDQARLDELERVLAALQDLARKHRCAPGALHQRLDTLTRERERLAGSAGRMEAARARRERALSEYRAAALELHRRRTEAATRLEQGVNGVLQTLGMRGASVSMAVEHDPVAPPAGAGTDAVSLQASTNPGQLFLPLARVASGGELSRIALAIHATATSERGAGTVVFDEVDAGVGGAVAEIVGRRMRALGELRQVLTVTHLPQVAALAHHHVLVHKQQLPAGDSRSEASALHGAAREQEIARMLGGLNITAKTLAHAREMLRAGAPDAPRQGGGPRRPAA